MLFVNRIGHGVEEQFEARKAADVLWQAAPLAGDEAGISLAGIAGSDIFDCGGVVPVVAHVVGIRQLMDAAVDERSEPHVLRCGEVAVGPIGIGNAIEALVDLELSEMIVLPAHGGLN